MKYSVKINVPAGLRGMDLLDTPIWNKGTAFDDHDRVALGLQGLLPPHIESLQEQSLRAYEAFQAKTTDLERHIYLRQLQDTNETLFCRLMLDQVEEMMPIVYTPTVGLACQQFRHIYRRPRGLFIFYPSRDSIAEILRNRLLPTNRRYFGKSWSKANGPQNTYRTRRKENDPIPDHSIQPTTPLAGSGFVRCAACAALNFRAPRLRGPFDEY
jgi:hypothetical protein